MKFRELRADEVEIRIGSVKDKGMSLLIYKDARADMKVLDESNVIWQRDHKELKGNIYGGVGIYNPKVEEWIWYWDAGSESYTEKEKGEASDSFKRACVNAGIGRELYTAPFIWVTGYGKYERFNVAEITYLDGRIKNLVVTDSKGKIAFSTKGGTKPSYVKKQDNVQDNVQDKSPDDIFSDLDTPSDSAPCTRCGGKTTFKEGIGKNDKPYKMNRCNDCNNADWL